MSDQEDDVGEGESIAQRRGRRSRGDKGGRLAALEKLKNARKEGGKNKFEVKEVDNVYDIVDEETYSKKVNSRLDDDWIVDDGTGYCETGHELFDDDLLDEDDYGYGTAASKKRNKNAKSKLNKPSKEDRENQRQNFLSVRDMLTNMPVKRKREGGESSSATASASDDLLGEMLQELHEDKKPRTSLPSGLKLLEKTKAVEKMISAGKIQEDKPFQSAQKTTVKRKFQAFKVSNDQPQIKSEPIEIDFNEDGFSAPHDTDSPHIEEFNSDEVKAEVKKEPEEKRPKTGTLNSFLKSSPKPAVVAKRPEAKAKTQHLQLQEVEDMGKYKVDGEVGVGKIVTDMEEMEISAFEGEEGQKLLNFYWFDIFEEPRNPGVLYLFGKVATSGNGNGSGNFVSCCVVIQNVQRCVYFLPREKMLESKEVDGEEVDDIDFVDVYEEFEKMTSKLKIPKFRARKVEKKYCFGEDVPASSQYMEVNYDGSLPPIPEDLQGNTFSKVFGTNSSFMENFLLKKMLKGPCWLQISNPVLVDSAQQQSWCKMEFTTEVNRIQLHPQRDTKAIPPFVVASLNINSVNDAASRKETIISASVVINKSFKIQSSVTGDGLFHDSFSLLHKPPGEVWPFDVDRVLSKSTTKMDSERSMLACFLAKLSQFDPDIYVGHDLNFDLLLLQLWNHKVPHWSRIGRLKRTSQPQKGSKMPDAKAALAGRLTCDVKISAMELIRARSYDLPSLATQVLGLGEDQVSAYTGVELRQLFETSEGIHHLSAWGMSLSILNLRLVNELQVMPLALQITTIAGNTLARTLMGGRSERNEFLLLHAFYNKDYIVPDKQFRKKIKQEDEEDNKNDKKGKSGGPSYVGGLVLDPKKGFYDNYIVLMDFLSLYPSIIQEFNICFTTCTTENHTDETERGILPEEIRRLVESRRAVKKLMQENVSPDLKRQYDIRQKALKLTANSMYGCLGFRNSRFYAKNLAALITGKGRDILMKTKEAVEGMGFEVIYGDTDSLMINTNSQEIQKVYEVGNKIKTEINKMYKLLELEIDGIFRFLLLLKKKKYAALICNVKANGDVETSLELKGLDIVRRDWAPVAASTARSILDEIMTEQPLDDKIYKIVKILSEKATELRAGEVPMKELLITKQLAKNPEEYKNKQGLYHVEVALKMNQSGKLPKKFKNGDTVPYLFCTDGLPHHPAELMAESKVKVKEDDAKAKDEEDSTVKQEKPLEPDAAYYLAQQVHPVVARICEPIPGLDGARIAEALGMDPSSFKRKRVVETYTEDLALGEMSEAEKYRDCERFKFLCANPDCRREITVESPFTEENGQWTFTLSKCPGCAHIPYNYMPHICNSLTLFMRKFIEKYYQGPFQCEDPACPATERAVNLRLERGYLVCPCKQGVMVREYTDFDLNKQLCYLLYAFDFDMKLEDVPEADRNNLDKTALNEAKVIFGILKGMVKNQLRRSAYSEINLGDLFAELIPKSRFKFNSHA